MVWNSQEVEKVDCCALDCHSAFQQFLSSVRRVKENQRFDKKL